MFLSKSLYFDKCRRVFALSFVCLLAVRGELKGNVVSAERIRCKLNTSYSDSNFAFGQLGVETGSKLLKVSKQINRA